MFIKDEDFCPLCQLSLAIAVIAILVGVFFVFSGTVHAGDEISLRRLIPMTTEKDKKQQSPSSDDEGVVYVADGVKTGFRVCPNGISFCGPGSRSQALVVVRPSLADFRVVTQLPQNSGGLTIFIIQDQKGKGGGK